jgi:hypothetical protein
MTEKSLDRILAQCLEEAERTGDIGAALMNHPEHANELRPLLELASVARRIYADVPPPPGGLAEGRARLLSQARQARSVARAKDRVPPRRKRGFLTFPRLANAFITAGITVAILAFALVGVSRAADGAVPGDPLYGLDQALEQVEVRLTRDPVSVAKMRLRLAEERLGEVAQLAQANDQAHLQEGLEGYGDAVVALSQTPSVAPETGDPKSISELDRVLASHEELLGAALRSAEDRWCTGQGTHPLADGLARLYAIDADTVRHWFCHDGYTFGEIVHALQTGHAVGGTTELDDMADELLTLKTRLGGWGQVWEASGLIGEPEKPMPTDEPVTSAPTKTPEPVRQTSTPQPREPTSMPQPRESTSTPQPLEPISTPQPRDSTSTPQPPEPTSTPQPLEPTDTPRPPEPTDTPRPPEPTDTPQPPEPTSKPKPSEPTSTPQPPG